MQLDTANGGATLAPKTNEVKNKIQPHPGRKTEKLKRIRARQEVVWQELRAREESPLDNGPLGKEWANLLHQGNTLEESFIHYQGRDIDTRQIAYQSGDININERLIFGGDESLRMDAEGGIYLWRKTGGRSFTHRLSVRAAILWAITRANPTTADLRKLANVALNGKEAA